MPHITIFMDKLYIINFEQCKDVMLLSICKYFYIYWQNTFIIIGKILLHFLAKYFHIHWQNTFTFIGKILLNLLAGPNETAKQMFTIRADL